MSVWMLFIVGLSSSSLFSGVIVFDHTFGFVHGVRLSPEFVVGICDSDADVFFVH